MAGWSMGMQGQRDAVAPPAPQELVVESPERTQLGWGRFSTLEQMKTQDDVAVGPAAFAPLASCGRLTSLVLIKMVGAITLCSSALVSC